MFGTQFENKLPKAQGIIGAYFGLDQGCSSEEDTILAWFLGERTLFQTRANLSLHSACASHSAALHSPTEVYKG